MYIPVECQVPSSFNQIFIKFGLENVQMKKDFAILYISFQVILNFLRMAEKVSLPAVLCKSHPSVQRIWLSSQNNIFSRKHQL